jgi:hypothetical protein
MERRRAAYRICTFGAKLAKLIALRRNGLIYNGYLAAGSGGGTRTPDLRIMIPLL